MEKRQSQEPKEKLHWALLIKEYPGNNPGLTNRAILSGNAHGAFIQMVLNDKSIWNRNLV